MIENTNKLFIISLILIIFIGINTVSSVDTNTTDMVSLNHVDEEILLTHEGSDTNNLKIENNEISESLSNNLISTKTEENSYMSSSYSIDNKLNSNQYNDFSFDYIESLIQSASSGSTITLDAGTYTGNVFIHIDKPITLTTNGKVTLDGKHKTSIFYITANNIVLKNLNLINGESYTSGGAIDTKGSLTCVQCNFSNNHAKYFGGAIYADNMKKNQLVIQNCNFNNNIVNYVKGYVCGGGAIYSDFNNNIILNSNFNANKVSGTYYNNLIYEYEGGKGGAIFAEYGIKCNGCTFINNEACEYGAIYSTITGEGEILSGLVTIENTYFNNKAKTGATEIGVLWGKINLKSFSSGKYKYFFTNKNNCFFTIKIVNKYTNKPVKGLKIKIYAKDYDYGNIKTIKSKTNGKGKVHFFINFPRSGTNFIISLANTNKKIVEFMSPIKKISTKVSAPKITAEYKKKKYFKVKVKNKKTKKAIKGLKLRFKIFTGKKYKIYIIKTNRHGVAKFNTKKLKVGKHKIVVYSRHYDYYIRKTSYITIKAKNKKTSYKSKSNYSGSYKSYSSYSSSSTSRSFSINNV